MIALQDKGLDQPSHINKLFTMKKVFSDLTLHTSLLIVLNFLTPSWSSCKMENLSSKVRVAISCACNWPKACSKPCSLEISGNAGLIPSGLTVVICNCKTNTQLDLSLHTPGLTKGTIIYKLVSLHSFYYIRCNLGAAVTMKNRSHL